MHFPILFFCEQSFPFLSNSLINEMYQKKLSDFCSFFSSDWNTSQIGFECPLSDQPNWVDFHCLLNTKKIPKDRIIDPSWELMSKLLKKWLKTKFLEKNHIGRTILEFDVGSSLHWPPKPNICLVFTPRTNPLLVAEELLSSLKRDYLQNQLHTIHHFLINGCTLDGMGLMLARSDFLRILVRVHNQNALESIFNSEQLEIVDILMKEVVRFSPPFLFEIDINEKGQISSRIGIGIPTRGSFPIESVLDTLCLRNWVSAKKKDALLNWLGLHNFSEVGSLKREIHHLKFTSSPQKNISVKAYLSNRFVAHE